jgi:hypothetical protein
MGFEFFDALQPESRVIAIDSLQSRETDNVLGDIHRVEEILERIRPARIGLVPTRS